MSEKPGYDLASQGVVTAGDTSKPEYPGRRPRTTFAGDVLRLATGTTLAQLITVLSSPLLTRFYAPEAFGLWMLFGSITSVIGVVVCLRYELSIMLPDTDPEAANLLGVSLVSAATISLLTIPLVLIGHGWIARLFRAPRLDTVLWLVPPVVLANGISLALGYWNSRTRNYSRVSASRVVASAGSTTVQLTAGAVHRATGTSLVVSTLVGGGIGTSFLAWRILHDDGRLFRRSINPKGILEGFRRHRKFPLYGTASALMNSISWQLPTFLLQYYFSAAVVGLYAFGNQLLRLPMNLIGAAIAQVFFQRAAEAKREGRLAQLVEWTLRRLITASFVPLVILGIAARDLFSVVFGARWAEAGTYTQILSAWTFFWFLSSPLSTIFSIHEKQEFGLKLNVVILSTRFLSLAVGGMLGSPRLAIVLFSATGILVYGYFNFAILSIAGVRWSTAARIFGAEAVRAIPVAALLVAGKIVGAPAWFEVILAAILLAGYFALVIRREPALLAMLNRLRLPRS